MMRLLLLAWLVLGSSFARAQTDSREWLNIKGKVHSVLQVRFEPDPYSDSLIIVNSDKKRFGNYAFVSHSQPLLIDNSYLEFSQEGRIVKWVDFNYRGMVRNELLCKYTDSKLLPAEMIIKEGVDTVLRIIYSHDQDGRFRSIEMGGIVSSIERDEANRVSSESFVKNGEATGFRYRYKKNRDVEMEFFDSSNSSQKLENHFNGQGDIVYDGNLKYEYEYDSFGNWIQKWVKQQNRLLRSYTRKIEYY